MRRIVLAAALLLVGLAPDAARAQEFDEYVNIPDGFKVNFPGTPTVTEITWNTQLNYKLPGKVYSANRGAERYSVTVVDYHPIDQMGVERAKSCPQGNANCRGNAGPALGEGYIRHDERGAIMFATSQMIQKAAKLSYLAWEWMDMVEGNILQLTNADESRTFAFIGMHERKLYIFSGTVPKGAPEPGLFQQSVGWVDKQGRGIRYQNIIYSNAYHGLGVYPVPPARLDGGPEGAAPAGAATGTTQGGNR